MQEKALQFGFRPADPAVPLHTGQADNLFTRLAKYEPGSHRRRLPCRRGPAPRAGTNLLALVPEPSAG